MKLILIILFFALFVSTPVLIFALYHASQVDDGVMNSLVFAYIGMLSALVLLFFFSGKKRQRRLKYSRRPY